MSIQKWLFKVIDMESILQFKEYRVLEQVYTKDFESKINHDEVKLREIKAGIAIDADDKAQGRVELEISLGDGDPNDNKFYVKVKVSGIFRLESDNDHEISEFANLLKVNGVAILFPYVRSLIAELTSKGSELPIILPTFNVAELLEEVTE